MGWELVEVIGNYGEGVRGSGGNYARENWGKWGIGGKVKEMREGRGEKIRGNGG